MHLVSLEVLQGVSVDAPGRIVMWTCFKQNDNPKRESEMSRFGIVYVKTIQFVRMQDKIYHD